MTREEAKKLGIGIDLMFTTDIFIDKIYDDFETDKFKNLKQAYSEGAIIEYYSELHKDWIEGKSIQWYPKNEYRIKDNISIDSWNVHKDVIKQYWKGAKVEWFNSEEWIVIDQLLWNAKVPYRVKPNKWKLPEYEDGSKWVAPIFEMPWESTNKIFTKSGRRRATKTLAEICAKNSKTRDLLEAYTHYIEPEWRDKGVGTSAWYISQNNQRKYGSYHQYSDRCIGLVYMSKNTAEQICAKLNKEEISLC